MFRDSIVSKALLRLKLAQLEHFALLFVQHQLQIVPCAQVATIVKHKDAMPSQVLAMLAIIVQAVINFLSTQHKNVGLDITAPMQHGIQYHVIQDLFRI